MPLSLSSFFVLTSFVSKFDKSCGAMWYDLDELQVQCKCERGILHGKKISSNSSKLKKMLGEGSQGIMKSPVVLSASPAVPARFRRSKGTSSAAGSLAEGWEVINSEDAACLKFCPSLETSVQNHPNLKPLFGLEIL